MLHGRLFFVALIFRMKQLLLFLKRQSMFKKCREKRRSLNVPHLILSFCRYGESNTGRMPCHHANDVYGILKSGISRRRVNGNEIFRYQGFYTTSCVYGCAYSKIKRDRRVYGLENKVDEKKLSGSDGSFTCREWLVYWKTADSQQQTSVLRLVDHSCIHVYK